MKILLATDIFGYTNAIETFKHRFESVCEEVHILDPYDATCMDFHDETEAYATFTQTCGLENYAKMCQKTLDAFCDEEVIIIGFSMGASAIWKALDGRKDAKIKGFFGFYASQIRYFLDANPHVPCTLIFPNSEKHFDVDALIKELVKHETVTCLKTAYLHGFMNPLSLHYDAKGYVEYCQFLEEAIRAMRLEN
ncbi:MAG: hypothetical protein EOL93_02750 [Epsilonproteobacteria bacterium]|nr:hypothetical protein [Campylobacterota bacterium]